MGLIAPVFLDSHALNWVAGMNSFKSLLFGILVLPFSFADGFPRILVSLHVLCIQIDILVFSVFLCFASMHIKYLGSSIT